jgi:hypothetical protein
LVAGRLVGFCGLTVGKPNSAPTQYLAGGYELVRRYGNADPAMRVLNAAGDARRLGHTDPLPIDFLRDAAQETVAL